ncbi:SDR family NAD(P)-dependent oxidoreductase [Peterkaempfera bronchialis]|uniref:SDR family NAD(P)-dependent oxidoreductase n=1 Tax=Peterkaempfera bronchialis TaxID=2126346 RepID=UPI003C2AD258
MSDGTVAVIGYACRVPGARGTDGLWETVVASRDSVTRAATNIGATTGGRVHAYGVLEGTDLFDADFFGYSPREAAEIDPQQRLLLECAVEALEDAGVRVEGLPHDIGVYAATGLSGYLLATGGARTGGSDDLATLMGGDSHYAATRIAYKLGLTGPAMAVGSACSSSLLAIHTAAQAIRTGECDLALAGGMDVEFPQPVSYLHQEGGILSRGGTCRPFDEGADGTVFGSGGGLVLLADLDLAEGRGWPVRAVLLGSAANNDGSAKASFTAPRAARQADVVAQALAAADIRPAEVRYLECHGTGTQLGDRTELDALAQVFGKGELPVLGSAKANFGHLRVGAGVVGFIKSCEVVARGVLPPLANLSAPMDAAADAGARLLSVAEPFDAPPAERIAGVSSFGFGGTNVHAVLRGHDPAARPAADRPVESGPLTLRLSAADPDACLATASRFAAALEDGTVTPVDLAHTLARGRDDLAYRYAVVAGDCAALAAGLVGDPERTVEGWARPGGRHVLLLPGQGADLLPVARALNGWEPVFTEVLADWWRRLTGLLSGVPELADALARPDGLGLPSAHALHTGVAFALARQLDARGLVADRIAGYSLGEYAAAAAAGALTADDALRLVVERARLLAEAPMGGLVVVQITAEQLEVDLPDTEAVVRLASDRYVLAAPADGLAALLERLTALRVQHRPLDLALPYHSRLLAGVAARFAPVADAVTPADAGRFVPLARGRDRLGAGYWSAHLAGPIDLDPVADTAAELAGSDGCTVVDLSPDGFLARCLGRDAAPGTEAVPLFGRGDDLRSGYLTGLAALWTAGAPLDPAAPGSDAGRIVALPAREFSRQSHLKEIVSVSGAVSGHDRRGVRRERSLDRWAYHPSWRMKRRSPERPEIAGGRWLVMAEADGPTAEVVAGLRALGVDCVHLLPGEADRDVAGALAVVPGDEDSVKGTIRALGLDRNPVDRVVHLWCADRLDDAGTLDGRLATLGDEYAKGFYTLLYAVQEIALQQGSRPLELDVAARGMHPADGDRALIVPERALLAGPGLVIPQDFPAMSARTLDVTALPADRVAAELLAELTAVDGDTTVALAPAARWVRAYERDHLPAVPEGRRPARLREGGVYLITGGLGGIGMTLAEYLVRACRAKLVLTGMEAVPDASLWEGSTDAELPADPAAAERVTRIRKLVAMGGEVMAARCDAADREATAALFAAVDRRFGGLDGVVHAAGVFETQRAFRGLDDTGREDCERRLRPKVEGTLVLAECLRGRRLDFVLMQSSLSAHLGGLGFYAYTAGNAFMDAFAERHRDDDIPWMTVNWDGWIFRERDDDTVHQSVVSPSFASPDFGVVAEIAIRPSEGQQLYARLMDLADPHQVLVSTADFEQRIAQWVQHQPKAAAPRPAATVTPDPEDHWPDAVEAGVAEAWREVLGVRELEPSSDFFALGGDSLLGVSVVHRLSLKFDVVLSVITMFEKPTIADTADEIRRLRQHTSHETRR